MKTSEQMRHEIMITVKANQIQVTGEFWLMLAFRTQSELAEICREMNISTEA